MTIEYLGKSGLNLDLNVNGMPYNPRRVSSIHCGNTIMVSYDREYVQYQDKLFEWRTILDDPNTHVLLRQNQVVGIVDKFTDHDRGATHPYRVRVVAGACAAPNLETAKHEAMSWSYQVMDKRYRLRQRKLARILRTSPTG